MWDAFGGGGVAHTVVALTNHLAATLPERTRIEVISLFRHRDRPRFPLHERVGLRVLVDRRNRRLGLDDRAQARHQEPTRLRPMPFESEMSRLTDDVLAGALRRLPPSVLVSTRPSLHLAATRFAPPWVRTVGQDHGNFETRSREPLQAAVMRHSLGALDVFVALTEADARDYRALADGMRRGSRARVEAIPNAVPWDLAEQPASLANPVVVTAGRLDANKDHARMIRAFAPVAARHPAWQLHIYGAGPERQALEELVSREGLGEHVRLQGYSTALREALAQASVFALTSHSEGFPMTLIEAMSLGLPPVSMDCPRGPAEIIADDVDGRLVPADDEAGFTAALDELVADHQLRRRLGANAWAGAHRYTMSEVGRRWTDLLGVR